MNRRCRNTDLADKLSRQCFQFMSARLQRSDRTYGFEYEFLPDRILGLEDMARLDNLLETIGGRLLMGDRVFDNGMRVTFEPGGQIEYCSPPMLPEQDSAIDRFLEFIDRTNARIYNALDIAYIGTGYIPGRADSPLCLRSDRYLNLHRRLAASGSRGHEMMKGTAAIHLHASICSMDELPALFHRLCRMPGYALFKMSGARRDIWNNTDPTRCGMPPCCLETISNPEELIRLWVGYALQVIILGEEVPFKNASDRSFDAFLHLLTTIFTDIRFNMKGPTLELRTPDSVPVNRFRTIWTGFIEAIESE